MASQNATMKKEEEKKKIYFGGSVRGGRGDSEIYHEIVKELKKFGEVLNEIIAAPDLKEGEKLEAFEKDTQAIYDGCLRKLRASNFLVAEVTQPSHGVGYEIGRTEVELKIPILCLYRPKDCAGLSSMIKGAHNGKSFFVVEYNDVSEVHDKLENFFSKFV